MILTRRAFIPLAASCVIFPSIGCGQSEIAALVGTVGNAVAQLATVLGNTILAAQLQQYTTAAVTAVNAWKQGTPAQGVIAALDILAQNIALIPATPQIQGLILLATSTIEAILASLPISTPATARARTLTASAPVAPAKDKRSFEKAWNDQIAAQPALAAAKI